MGVNAEGLDDLDALLASGKISEDADVTEIAALLAGGDGGKSEKDAADAAATAAGADAEGGDAAKDKAEADAAAKAVADAAAAASTDANKGGGTSDPAQTAEPEGPIVTESGGTIPYGVLKGTRERLAEAQENLRRIQEQKAEDDRRIADLEQQLVSTRAGGAAASSAAKDVQAIADRAGVVDAAGNKVDVTKIDVAGLRGEFPDAVVNLLESLQQALVGHEETIRDLRARDASRTRTEVLSAEEQLQADIDAVPALAQWAADKDPKMFNRAVALDSVMQKEPEWASRSRVERYQEIARQLGGDVAPSVAGTAAASKPAIAPAQARTTVSAALQRASAQAAPVSHSDLPAGSAAAQSETDALEQMDVLQLAAKFEGMTPAQQEAYLARFG